MKKYITAFLIISITCLTVGFCIELYVPQWSNYQGEMFQRMGAVIVIVGSLMGWRDIAMLATLEQVVGTDGVAEMNKSIKKFNELANKANQVAAGEKSSEALDIYNVINIKIDVLEYKMRIHEEHHKIRGRALQFEIAILLTGTLVWGFGDIIYKLIM